MAVLLALFPFATTAAEDLSATLQRGLFEEEANHDLAAAIKAYETVVTATDAQRRLAATALFRLAECYRKMGRTNDALAHYRRVAGEYPDQPRLVELSRQQLAESTTPAAELQLPGRRLGFVELELFEAQGESTRTRVLYQTLTNLSRTELRRSLTGLLPDAALTALLQSQAETAQKLAQQTVTFSDAHPEVRATRSALDVLQQQIEDRIDGLLGGLRVKLQSQQAQVQEISNRLAMARTLTAREPVAGTTNALVDIEEAEIRRIQGLIQNSPDLINARNHFASLATAGVSAPLTGLTLLHKAAVEGRLKVAEFLLANGADVNAASGTDPASPGVTPLALAARVGNRSLVELLLARGANVQGNAAFTPLHEAASQGFRSVVEALLDAKADVNARATANRTPLHEAAARGFPGVTLALLARGADVNSLCESRTLPIQVPGTQVYVQLTGSALHMAADRGDLAMVELLLTNKAEANVRSRYGLTPLHVAVFRHFQPVAAALLKAGADVNAQAGDAGGSTRSPRHWTALNFAVALGWLDLAQFLLENRADPNRATDDPGGRLLGWTPLHQAAFDRPKDYLPMAELLLRFKGDPNVTNASGFAPIHGAIIPQDAKLLRLLLQYGANPDARDPQGRPPLSHDGLNGELCDLLLEHKADPNLADWSGNTPLHVLAQRARDRNPPTLPGGGPNTQAPGDLAERLLARGADPNRRNANGYSPLNTFGTPANPGTAAAIAFVGVLRRHGAKDELAEPPANPYSIRVWRRVRWAPRVVFAQDAFRRNRYTLLEALLNFYNLTQTPPSRVEAVPQLQVASLPGQPLAGPAPRPVRIAWGGDFKPVEDMPFPDLTRIRILRLADPARAEQRVIEVNLLNAAGEIDCARDQVLEFGDIIELPEREFRLNEPKVGLTRPQSDAMQRCLQARVRWVTREKAEEVGLNPMVHQRRLAAVLQDSPGVRALLSSASDLSRLTVRRIDPVTQRTSEFTVDASETARARLVPEDDLVLRDGDVVEVPAK